MTDEQAERLARSHANEYPSIGIALDAKDKTIDTLKNDLELLHAYCTKIEGQLAEMRAHTSKT